METPEVVAGKAGALMKFVGAIVVYYAILEHWIDGMVAAVHLRVDGAKEIEKTYPTHAAHEVEFLRECFGSLAALAEFKAGAIDFLDKLRPLAEFRHNIVHGHIRNIDWASETVEFSRIVKGLDKNPARRTLTIVASELFHQGEDIRALIPAARELTHRLVQKFGTQEEFDKLNSGP
jgi:hypothetical protein